MSLVVMPGKDPSGSVCLARQTISCVYDAFLARYASESGTFFAVATSRKGDRVAFGSFSDVLAGAFWRIFRSVMGWPKDSAWDQVRSFAQRAEKVAHSYPTQSIWEVHCSRCASFPQNRRRSSAVLLGCGRQRLVERGVEPFEECQGFGVCKAGFSAICLGISNTAHKIPRIGYCPVEYNAKAP